MNSLYDSVYGNIVLLIKYFQILSIVFPVMGVLLATGILFYVYRLLTTQDAILRNLYKKRSIFLGFLFFILLLYLSVSFIYLTITTPHGTTPPPIPQTENISLIPQTKERESTTLNTYVFKEFGISFQYPLHILNEAIHIELNTQTSSKCYTNPEIETINIFKRGRELSYPTFLLYNSVDIIVENMKIEDLKTTRNTVNLEKIDVANKNISVYKKIYSDTNPNGLSYKNLYFVYDDNRQITIKISNLYTIKNTDTPAEIKKTKTIFNSFEENMIPIINSLKNIEESVHSVNEREKNCG